MKSLSRPFPKKIAKVSNHTVLKKKSHCYAQLSRDVSVRKHNRCVCDSTQTLHQLTDNSKLEVVSLLILFQS